MTRRTAHRPRKDAVQSRSKATVEAILEAAARILEQDGEAAANTNAIAEAAGVSVGSLYQYFPNKASIVMELLRRAERAAADDIERLLVATAERPFTERLEALVAAALRQQFDRPALARALDYFESRAPRDAALEACDRAIIASLAGFLVGVDDDPETAATDLLAMTKGMIDQASERGETDLRSLQARVLRAVTGYLGVAQPAKSSRRKSRVSSAVRAQALQSGR